MPSTGLDTLVQALPSTTGSFAQAPVSVTPVAAQVAVATPVPHSSASPVVAGTSIPSGPVLQVASFSSLGNARRALERLVAGGVSGAQLDDVVAGGRTLWRLRVVPDGRDVMELAARIAGLGLGTPQLVHD